MSRSLVSGPVAKKKTTSVRLAADVHRKVDIICTAKGVPMSDYVSDLLRPLVEKEFPRAFKQLQKEFPKADSDSED
jgi:hypothetical protein